MMQAITTPLSGIIPPKPSKGDIAACDQYIRHQTRNQSNPNTTRASLWIKFIVWSYLTNNSPKPKKYTGWKQQQAHLKAMGAEVSA